jgi:enterochelin esterase-like enzyme
MQVRSRLGEAGGVGTVGAAGYAVTGRWQAVGDAGAGELYRSEPLSMPELGVKRRLVAWLPTGEPPRDGWPLVVFHDGQNLFDEHAAISPTWGLSATLSDLAARGLPAVVVGVPHGGDRRRHELSPFWEEGVGTAYTADLVVALLPAVRDSLPVTSEGASTFVAGSSLGGLISIYAVFAFPSVFGGCAVLSPAIGRYNEGAWGWLENRPKPEARVYVDVGWREIGRNRDLRRRHTSSAHYRARVRRLRRLLLASGFRDGVDLRYVEDPGGIHHETAWAGRIGPALEFLLAAAHG